MIRQQSPVDHQTPAGANVMPHMVHLDEKARQPDRGDDDRLVRAFDMALGERSAAAQRARATQRLAALGEMTGGLCMISEISWR